jgi:hypothetical protein
MTPQPARPESSSQSEPLGSILGFGLLGLCCLPFGLVAGALGLRSYLRARNAGLRPAPVAYIGLGFAAMSLVLTSSAVVFSVVKNAQRDQQKAALEANLGSKRDAQDLDAAAACDLAKLYYLAPGNSFFDGIECSGSLRGEGPVRTLSGVVTVKGKKRAESTVCLARGHRWFVLAALDADGACPKQGPEVRGPKGTAEALEAEERAWRDAEAERVAQQRIARFDRRREVMAAAIEAFDEQPTELCGRLPADARTVPSLERRLLRSNDDGNDDFDFLTSSSFRRARWADQPVEQAKNISTFEAAGPLVVIFDATRQEWPTVQNGSSYRGGVFQGRLLVADFAKGVVVCAAPLSALSATDVTSHRITKLESREHALERAIENDFEDRLKAKARAALDELTHGTLAIDF